jgi:hypothetical protein
MNTSSARTRILLFSLIPIAGVTAFFIWNSYFHGSKLLRTHPVLKKDYQLLKNEDAKTSVESIAMALHRLNSYRLPEGLSEALKREKDPRPQVRSAVAESLAMNVLKGEVLETSIRFLSDPDESVRVAALTAIGRVGDPRRVEILNKAMQNPAKSVREALLIQSGLYAATQGADRADHLKSIHAILDQNKGDPASTTYGLKVLLRVSPNDRESMDRIESAFLDSKTAPELIPALYRQIVRARPELLKKRFSQDARSKFVALRITALNSILELCPPDRWNVIQWAASDESVDAQSKVIARRIATYLGGKVDANGSIQNANPSSDRCVLSQQKKPAPASAGKPR